MRRLDFDGLDGCLGVSGSQRPAWVGVPERAEANVHEPKPDSMRPAVDSTEPAVGAGPETPTVDVTDSLADDDVLEFDTAEFLLDELELTETDTDAFATLEPLIDESELTETDADAFAAIQTLADEPEPVEADTAALGTKEPMGISPEDADTEITVSGLAAQAEETGTPQIDDQAPGGDQRDGRESVVHGGEAKSGQSGPREAIVAAGGIAGLVIAIAGGAGLLSLWWGDQHPSSSDRPEEIARMDPQPKEALATSGPSDIEADTKETSKDSPIAMLSEAPSSADAKTAGSTQQGDRRPERVATPASVSSPESAANTQAEPTTQASHEEAKTEATGEATATWTIPFSFNQLEVRADALRGVLLELKPCVGRIVVTGHTCAIGGPEANRLVGLARADSIRRALVGSGVSADRIEMISAGSHQPVATNATREGRRANRRVEIDCRVK